MEKLELIGAIVGLLATGGLIKALIHLKNEIQDVVKVYKADAADGKIDNPELIVKEVGEAILQGFKVWEILKKAFLKWKSDKKK